MATTSLVLYSLIRPLFQPMIGAFHGWFATRMVVVMLFRPYKAYTWPGTKIRIPFTPGIFPSRKRALAENIARTVTQTLLTPADIQARSDQFITEANLEKAVNVVVETLLEGAFQPDKLELIAATLREQLPSLLNSTAQNFLLQLTRPESPLLAKLIHSVIHDGLMRFRLSEPEAQALVHYAFTHFFAPAQVRSALLTALTPQRAQSLQQVLLTRTTGPLRFIFNFVNVESLFVNFKDYLEKEPEKSEDLIGEFMLQLRVQEELTEQLVALDLSRLAPEDIDSLKLNLGRAVRHYLMDGHDKLLGALVHLEGLLGDNLSQRVLALTPDSLSPQLREGLKREVLRFATRYFKQDLGRLIQKGIALLKPDEMIISKVEAYSSADIEQLILGIMRRELKNLELLGLLIGLVLGMSALAIEYFLPIR
ncbi:MAG: DUF445 family protein [Candidatus Sericytochromatia bacterium]